MKKFKKNIKKKFFNRKTLIISLIIFWGLIIAFTVVNFFVSKTEKTSLDSKYYGKKIEKWNVDGKDVTFPYTIKDSKQKIIRQTTKIPKDVTDDTAIMFLNNYNVIHVYIDKKLVYSYGTVKQLPFGNMLGNLYLMVPIKKADANKTLCIETQQVYNLSKIIPFKSVTLPEVCYGDIYGLRLGILHNNLWRIALLAFLLIMILLSAAFSMYQIISGAYHTNIKGFLFFSAVSLAIAGWILGDSSLLQFVTDSNEANSFLIYISLASLGIPYLGYCAEILPSGKKFITKVEYAGLILPIMNTVCFIFNICDPVELQTFTHMYFIIAITVSLFFAIRDWRNSPYSKALVINMLLAFLSAMTGLVVYFLPGSQENALYAVFFGVGFVLFVFNLLAMTMVREINFIQERLSMELYKEMAYTDKLTNCGNRAGFDKDLEEGIKEKNNRFITLVLADLNHLKKVNDEIGHDAGDELIYGGALCLKDAFAPFGEVYRLGGDEFAVILWNEKGKMDYYLHRLDDVIKKYNKESKYTVSMAKGYFEQSIKDTKEEEKDIDNIKETVKYIYREADHNMYIDKEKCHKKLDK